MKPSSTTTSGKSTDMIAGICTFPRLPCPCTKLHVMLNLTSTGVCNTGTSALYVCNLLPWLTWWWMLLYRTPRKVTNTNMRKKHVRRHSMMCCCCCRFFCGAPTTDERMHAPVLYDASQIAYCSYWGRASLPPITSTLLQPQRFWFVVYVGHKYQVAAQLSVGWTGRPYKVV